MKYIKQVAITLGLASLSLGVANAFTPPPGPAETYFHMHVVNNYMKVSNNVTGSSNMAEVPEDRYVLGGATRTFISAAYTYSSDSFYTFALSMQGPNAPGACVLKYDYKAPGTLALTLLQQSNGSQGFICSVNGDTVTINPV